MSQSLLSVPLCRIEYIRFLLPGTLTVVEKTQAVSSRSVTDVVVPRDAFAYEFFSLLVGAYQHGEESVEVTSSEFDSSARYFISRNNPAPVEEALVLYPGAQKRLRSLRDSYAQVINPVCGGWQGFDARSDFVVRPEELLLGRV